MTRAYNGFFASAKRLQRSFPVSVSAPASQRASVITRRVVGGYEGALRLPPCREPCEIGLVDPVEFGTKRLAG